MRLLSTKRIVNVLVSKQLRMVVTCQRCPISPNTIAGNQKTACIHLRKATKKERKEDNKTIIIKEQQCIYYEKDSLNKLDNGMNIIECNF